MPSTRGQVMTESHSAQDKRQRILDAVEKQFALCDLHNLPPALKGAPIVLGEQLGMSPAEVSILLRRLHREGRIGLVSNGSKIDIARTQQNLNVRRTISTKGGRVKRTSPEGFVRTPVIPPRPEPTETEKLQAEVDRLSQLAQDLQDKLTKSERHRNTANEEREAARNNAKTMESELNTARIAIRRLEAEVSDSQGRVADLEAQLKAARAQNSLAPEVVARLAAYAAHRSH